jgi:phage shock protein C
MTDYTSPTPPPVTPIGQRRLHRSRQYRMVAGVAGGLAEYFDVDPAAVRLGFVALSLLSGGVGGPVLYLLAWAILPEE